MTWLKLKGQQIFKGVRAVGQSNPSPQYLFSQQVAGFLWSLFRQASFAIRNGWTSKEEKQPQASAWYKEQYPKVLGFPDGPPTVESATLTFSKGTMSDTAFTAEAVPMSFTIQVDWPVMPVNESQLSTDRVILVALNATRWEGGSVPVPIIDDSGVASRADGGQTITFPSGSWVPGDLINVYASFYGEAATDNVGTSSNTQLIVVEIPMP